MLATSNPPAPSMTSRERRNPPPRQKSCGACIKAKRRCDAGFPSCLRCSQRGIACEFPAGQKGRRRGSCPSPFAATAAAAAATPAASTTTTVDEGIMPDFLSTAGITEIPNNSACASFEENPFFTSTIDPALPLFGETNLLDMEQEPPHSSFSFPLDTASDPNLGLVHQSSTMAAPSSRTFEYSNVPEMARIRLWYAIDETKKMPSSMVEETQTPWCHPRLYEEQMPRSMQDAYACCAMYMSKNRQNSPVILRNIDARFNELVSQPEPTTPLESLAHTHALLLYHIIRVFDGDIGARASAERSQSALEDSAMALLAHANFDISSQHPVADLPLHPLGPAKAFWKDWIFQESARRTLLFTFFLLQAYRILAGHPITPCDGKLGMMHSFTLSAPLWHARSAVEFARAWAETRHLVLSNGEADVVLRHAKAHHVDLFGKIIMTSLLGVEETEGWFASKGGSLWNKSGFTA